MAVKKICWQSRIKRVKCQSDGKLPLDEEVILAVFFPHSAVTDIKEASLLLSDNKKREVFFYEKR